MEGARETVSVAEDERDVGLLEDPVLDKGLPLWHGDDLGQQVG